ncbi:MAG: ABC transporter substrate-binding protein, partial [Planctomycetia bacterium]|nr:ABC transporter substrate-binding protein [Planctomycetia bacterium]
MTMKITRRAVLHGAALSTLAPNLTWAFDRDGNRKILVFSGNQAVPVLDPHVRYDWSTRMIQQSVYDGLLKYVGNPPKIIPWLAEKWEASADGLTYTFHLVKNAKFHNGDPLDSEAVRYSYERALKMNSGIAWMLKDFLKPDKIVAVDAHTVRFTLEKPFAPFISYVPWWYIVNPKQVLANVSDGDFGRKWLTENAAGSGPFKLRRFDANALIHLDAVPDYWKGWPMGEANRLSGVIYRIVREAAPRRAGLQRREMDVITNMSPDDMSQLAKLPGVRNEDHPGFTTFGIKFNCQSGPTADINLRKAIAYAFDYEALITIHNGGARLMDSPQGLPRQEQGPQRRHRAGIRPCARPRGCTSHRPGAARQPASLEHPAEHRGPALDHHGGAWRQARHGPQHDFRLCDAGWYRPRHGRLPVPSRVVGPVLRHVALREPRGLGDDRRGARHDRQGQAQRALRRDPAPHRRRPAGAVRHAAQPHLGDARLREGLRVQPDPLHRRGRSLSDVDRGLMFLYLLRRFALAGLMLFGLVCLTFIIANIAPADPAALAAGPDAGRSQIEQARREYGLDKPLPEQFLRYVTDLAHG